MKNLFLVFMLIIGSTAYASPTKIWQGCEGDGWSVYDPELTGDAEVLKLRLGDAEFIKKASTEFNLTVWGDDEWWNNDLSSPKTLILNAIYLHYKTAPNGSYINAGKWIEKMTPVCRLTTKIYDLFPTHCGTSDAMCSYKTRITLEKIPFQVEYMSTYIPMFNVVERASTIYHESLHASLGATLHGATLDDGSVAGNEVMWLYWFSADAYPLFSDKLRVMAHNWAIDRSKLYGMQLFDVPTNVEPRRKVYSWGGWMLPAYMPQTASNITIQSASQYQCYMTYGASGQVEKWEAFPSPGSCFVRSAPAAVTNTASQSSSYAQDTQKTCSQLCNGNSQCIAMTAACRN